MPAFAYRVHVENQNAPSGQQVNLKGVSIGDGWSDPETMVQAYPDLIYNVGLADFNQRSVLQDYCDRAVEQIQAGNYTGAFYAWDEMLNGDLITQEAYYVKITGLTDYYNFLRASTPADFNYFSSYVQLPEVRKAIHVGNNTFHGGSKVEEALLDDIMHSVKPWVATLLESGYKALIYNGMLDIIVGSPLTEAYLRTVPWKGQSEYLNATRTIWKSTDGSIAGYVRSVLQLRQVNVRNCGHILPYDAPAEALDMITRFVDDQPF